ncbi:MAG: NADH-dependent [FeFe] hydrogenase, group A6 [Eubacteriales bacterium]|nr:NADH-dependent [FeFe] hydrogenase, group A6 [Eubacteriales bacterium]
MVNLTIDGKQVQVKDGTSVLEAARQAHIHIPTLCFLKGTNAIGACRVCVVDAGARTLQASCVLEAREGMVVNTNTPKVREARKTIVELILSNHDKKCLSCVRNQNCELQKLAMDLGIDDADCFNGEDNKFEIDHSSKCIERDNNKCILCRRCVAVCKNSQACGVIGPVNRGFKTSIESPWELPINSTACIGCGQCVVACPTGALRETSEIDRVWNMLADDDLHVVVQTAPAVRAALGEEFGIKMGTNVTGRMVAALRRLRFNKVFDTDFAADLTIMEEATELLERINNNGVLPMITSCSPGWINYCEVYYPEFISNLSSCKSPHEMMGAVIKSYYAEKENIPVEKIRVVSVMPCTAKKGEARRPQLAATGYPDVDAVITTRELAKMIKASGMDFVNLPEESFDPILGESTGAGVIFGATGGVMEAALRTAYETITGETLDNLDFTAVRGISGIKEASVNIGGTTLNVAVANGTANAKKLLDRIKSGEKQYHFIEIMGCPGGCVNGGGQPVIPAELRFEIDPRVERAKALYREDAEKVLRKSHENPSIKKIYEEFFEKPNSYKAHHLLHTTYKQEPKYKIVPEI